jgi:hypothetical protein
MGRRLGLTALGITTVAVAILGYLRLRALAGGADDSARIRALEERLALFEKQRRAEPVTRTVAASEPRMVVPVPPTMGVPEQQPRVARPPAGHPPIDEAAVQREYFGDLDERLGGEARDPDWAAATEERLRTSARDLRPRITVDNAQCGHTMCRVEASVTDAHEDVPAMEKFISSSLALFPEAVIRDGEAPGRHIVYFARKGGEFPPMNPPEPAQ